MIKKKKCFVALRHNLHTNFSDSSKNTRYVFWWFIFIKENPLVMLVLLFLVFRLYIAWRIVHSEILLVHLSWITLFQLNPSTKIIAHALVFIVKTFVRFTKIPELLLRFSPHTNCPFLFCVSLLLLLAVYLGLG